MKPGRLNDGTDHLSFIETGDEPTNIDDGFPNAQLFWVDIADDQYSPIIQFLETGVSPQDLLTSQKKQLVVKASNFQLITGKLYKLGPDEILRQCILPHEQGSILAESRAATAKVGLLCVGIW